MKRHSAASSLWRRLASVGGFKFVDHGVDGGFWSGFAAAT